MVSKLPIIWKRTRTAHAATWTGLWNRSYVDISAAKPPPDSARARTIDADVSAGAEGGELDDDVEAVNDAYVWQRYLDLADGRNTWGVIKFNGQVRANKM